VDQSTLDTYKEKIKKEEQYKEKLKSMKDKEGRPIYDYLTKEIFAKIVQQRKKRSLKEKSPQPLSE
jgi:lysophospholipase L1-like esterase